MIRALVSGLMLAACAAAGFGVGMVRAQQVVPENQARRVQGEAKPEGPRHLPQLNTLRDVAIALEICWQANEPPLAQARPGMNVTVMLTFNRSGALLGEPRFTYITPEATPETKARYQRAVVAAIDTCTPLPFSPALGNALAGTPKVMPFVDRRNQKGI